MSLETKIALITVCLGVFFIAGCTTPPKRHGVDSAPASPSVVTPALVIPPQPPAPPPETFAIALKDIPRQSFKSVSQTQAPQPLWTLDHYHPLGHPAISQDGRWLALNRAEGKEGKVIVLFDLLNRKSSEYPVPAPGLVGEPVFSRDSKELWSVVNSSSGFAFSRWSLPAMNLQTVPLESGEAIHAAFTHAQDRVVVMRADGVAAVFDLASAAKLHEVTYQQTKANFYFTSLAISPDDQFVSSGVIHPGNEYVRWRLADGARVETVSPKEHLSWGRPAITTRDGKTIFVAAHHELLSLDAATGERRATYPGNGLNTLHYQPTFDLVAAPVGQGETFALIDGATGQTRFTAKHAARPPAEYGYVNWAAVAPDGKTAYSGSYFTLFAWDISTLGSGGPDFLSIGNHYRTLLPSADGNSLIAAGETLDTWDLRSRRILSTQASRLLRGDRAGDSPEWRTGRSTAGVWRAGDAVHALRLDEEGAQIYDAVSEKPLLRLGSPRSAVVTKPQDPHTALKALWQTPSSYPRVWFDTFPFQGGYLHLAASPDGRHLVVTTFDGQNPCATLWSTATGRLLAVLADSSVGARLARFSPDGQSVLLASSTGGLAIFHLREGLAPTLEIVSHASPEGRIRDILGDVAMSGTNRLYVGTTNGVLQSWHRSPDGGWHLRFEHRLTDNNTSAQFPAPVARLGVSPSGRTLAVALFNPAEQGSILIINTDNGAIRSRLDEHVSDIGFLDERTLATTGIRLWTLE
jgi:WD40 repeat protein